MLRVRTRLLAAASAVLATTTALVIAAVHAEAASTVYQAESATLSGGAVTATDHAGYTGSGFVGGYVDGNKGNAATTFHVTTTSAASRQLVLRYANGTGSAMTLSLYVNGTKSTQVSLGATANWDTWGTRTDTVSLPSGNSTVAYKFDTTDSGNVNLDSLTVNDIAAPPSGTFEAESAALSGGTAVATDHSGYNGSGFVGGYTDGNKGNAATTFTVSRTAAGATPVALRYANGTGATMTLSVYANGTKVVQTSLAATANWDTWTTKSETLPLNVGSNSIAYKFDTTDSGNVNLDDIVVSAAASPTPTPSASSTPPPPTGGAELETAFVSGGVTTATSLSGYTGSGYVTGFTAVGARVIRTVNVSAAGNATATVRYANSSGSTKTLSTYANGLKVGQVSLPSGSGWLTAAQTVAVRAGVNLIGYQMDSGDSGTVSLDNVAVSGSTALATRGATLPYTEYEAESGSTTGSAVGPDRTYGTVAAEASGRRAVSLTNGKYVQFTLTKPTSSLVVRFSIPDAGSTPLAIYANGTKVKDLTLAATYSWVYGAYPYTNNPGDGSPHHYFDDARTTFSTTYPAGTVLKLQNDASTTITVDLIDTEVVPAALTQPAGSVSVTNYGATANDGSDDTAAFNSAISANAGKILWVPAGTFNLTSRLNVANITIRGAGEWFTTIQGANGKGGFNGTGSGVQLSDFTVSGDVRYRDDTNFDAALDGNWGSGSLIHNLWIEHTKVGLWATGGVNGLYAVALRIRDTMADGVNFNDTVTGSRLDESTIRNTGDDAMAMWSHTAEVTNSAFTFNTVALPMLANTSALYGGNGDRIEDNLFSDTVRTGAGFTISSWQSALPFQGTTVVQRNTLTRTGSFNPDWNSSQGAIWVYAEATDITGTVQVKNIDVNDSSYQGILLSYLKNITNLTFDHVAINGAGTWGIELNAAGSATFTYVTVTGAASGGLLNDTGYTVVRGAGDSGF